MDEVQAADEVKLPELELQIKTNLLPLKGKVISQLQVAAAEAAKAKEQEEEQEMTRNVSAVTFEESYLSEGGSTSRESSEVGLDDLDAECISIIMEEAEER